MRIFSKLTSLVSAAAMVLTMAATLPATPAAAASAAVIDTTKTYQYIRGFGGINHPEWTGKDLTDAQRKTAFGNGDNELGLTILRVFVNPNSNQWNLAVPTAKYATQQGVTIFASPWEPPANLAASGGTGGLKGKLHLPESNYAAYAEHLNNFGKYMKEQGVDLYSISVQNEPDYAEEWTAWTPAQTTSFIANYGDKITSTRLMSPESFQYGAWNNGKDYYKQILANPKAMANCDLFGTHFYGTERRHMDFPDLENCGKEIWMTEVYVPNSDADSANRWPEALQVSENIHNGLVVGSMSAYTWWYIRRSYGLMTEDGVPSKRGWCMAQYSKYVRPGAVRIDATESPADGVLVSAYKNADGTVAIVAINKSNTEQTQQFTLGSGEAIIDVDRYRTSASENCKATLDMEYSGSGFWSQLPANSVSTYVVTLEGGSTVTPVQPTEPTLDEDGYFFHDRFEQDLCDWSARGASSVMTSGRVAKEGKESLLVQERTSAWHGATKALSTKTFQPGKAYSFSVEVTFMDADIEVDSFSLKLQYTGSDGETHYASIAEGKTMKGKYVQLANEKYTIPEGASDLQLYVETPETTNNFYIDEAIGAPEGTKISGSGQPEIIEPTTPPASNGKKGDLNIDSRIDVIDLVMMKRVLLGKANVSDKICDIDGNGKVELTDYVMLYKFVHGILKEFPAGSASPDQPSVSSGMGLTREAFTAWASAKMLEKEPEVERTDKAGVQYGTVTKVKYYSNTCNKERPFNILLPANYSTDKKYPVLYVMHGYWENEDRMIDETVESLRTKQIIGNAIAAGEAEDMIVVFPYIYASATQDACSGMDDANNKAYDNFINELKNDLMPYIEKNYSVKTGKENTAITGFSMGGRESLYIGMKCSDMFGYVGAICAAPGANDLVPTAEFKFTTDTPYLLLLTAGSNDQTVYNIPEGYHNTLTANGVPHIWHYVDGGYHGDNCIRAHLYNFCRFIFKN